MPVKVNGQTSGSVTVAAPDTGSDVTLTLPGTTMNLATELASKLPIAGGKILQIVRATDATNRTTTNNAMTDASISVTITPQKSDSVLLLVWNALGAPFTTSGVAVQWMQITDSSNNAISGAERGYVGANITQTVYNSVTLIAYATPATTSAVTYKGRFRVDASGSGNTARFLNAESTAQLYAIEVSA